ncbi:Protein SERAC1 [Apiospora kogelbergensis]|uniref:Protein SERAC1 n=1 Tax=Apiospora kogelbergensis TaxID=1337665 RepID=UPI003131C2AC
MLTDDDSPSSEDENEILDGNLLMVDQLWLWAVDMTTLTTFFPKRESHPSEGPMFQQADLRNSVYNELNGDLTGRCDSALDLAAFTALHAVTVLLDRTSHRDLEIFRIFEEALGVLTERMTFSLKRFRMQTFRDRMSDESDSSELEDNRTESIKKRHKREIEQAERENRENTSALLELRDMDDELNTMENLFLEQKTTLTHMKEIYTRPELQPHTGHGRAYLDEALQRLDEYTQQVTGMRHRIEATRADYEKLLEMVQRQAQVDEVRWSRLQTELASTQNLSVMIFTTFTVIFLPLSFFTGLFGMNTQEWGGADDNFVSLRTIGGHLVARAAFKYLYRHVRAGVEGGKRQLGRMRPRASKEAKQRRFKLKEEREKDLKRKKERDYDFWETVRRERRSEYQIPDLNRKGASRRRLEGRATWVRDRT